MECSAVKLLQIGPGKCWNAGNSIQFKSFIKDSLSAISIMTERLYKNPMLRLF